MTESDIRFSVVIPVYNGAATIQRAIESCLRQSFAAAEIIVIDDGSEDDTEQLVLSFNHPSIQYIKNGSNRGPSHSRNAGMRRATGDWIVFLDADDVFHPDKLRVLRRYISMQSAARAIGHGFEVLAKGRSIGIPATLPTLKHVAAKQVLFRNPVVTPALAVLRSNDIWFDENMHYAEDHDFILRTAERYGLWYSDLPLCSLGRAPLTPGGLSASRWNMRKGEMHMYVAYAKRNGRAFMVPFLVLFSLAKHFRSLFFSGKHAGANR